MALGNWEHVCLGGMLTGNAEAMEMHRRGFVWECPDHERIADACCVVWAAEDWAQIPCHEIDTRRNEHLSELGFLQSEWGVWFEACIARFWEWANEHKGVSNGQV